MEKRKPERVISIFIRLGFDRPHGMDRLTKLQGIKGKRSKRTADVSAMDDGRLLFLYMN